MKRLLLTILLLLPLGVAAQSRQSAPAPKQDSLRLLFIGNSYTYYNDLPAMVYEIAKTQKKKLSVKSITKGGERLRGHLKNEKVRKALTEEHWDFVILQEQSSDPARQSETVIANIYPAARELDSLIHVGSPEAHTIFYMTWGHKYGTTHKIENYPIAYTYEGMQERIKTSYLEMTYRNKEGFSNITFFVRELYGLPWVWYFPSVSTDENFYIGVTYLPEGVDATSASAAIKALSPNSANLNNLGKQHESIYERPLKLRNCEVTALIIEYKEDTRNSVLFVYGDLLISVRCDPTVWNDEWFSGLSFE